MNQSVKSLMYSIESLEDEGDSMSIQKIEASRQNPAPLPALPHAQSSTIALQNRQQIDRWLDAKMGVKKRIFWLVTSIKKRLRKTAFGDRGMATAEYAIATLAAVGFAAVLIAILKSGQVRGFLLAIIQHALSF